MRSRSVFRAPILRARSFSSAVLNFALPALALFACATPRHSFAQMGTDARDARIRQPRSAAATGGRTGATIGAVVGTSPAAQRGTAAAAQPGARGGSGAGAGAARAAGAFHVSEFTPRGEAKPDDSVTISFSSDVSTSTLSTTRSATAIVAFDPAIDGTYQFESARKVRFYPRAGLRKGTRYTARVNPSLRDRAGNALSGEIQYQFATPALKLDDVKQVGFTPERRAQIELSFSDEVQPDDLRKYLTLTNGASGLSYSVDSDVRTAKIRITTDPLTSETLSVRINPGLTGAGGPLGMTSATDKLVALTFKLVAESIKPQWDADKVSLQIEFSNAVDLMSAKQHITISPAVPFEVEDQYDKLVMHGDFKPQTRYTVSITAGLQGANGQLLLKDEKLTAWVSSMKPFLEMKDAGGHLSSQGRMKLRVRSAGITSFTVTAERLYDNNLIVFAAAGGDEYDLQRFGHEVAKKDVVVAGAPNAPTLTEVDLRDVLGKDPAGVFRLQVEAQRPKNGGGEEDSDDESESGYYRRGHYYRRASKLSESDIISISNLGVMAKRSPNELTVWVAGLNDAKPRAGVRVQAYSQKNQLLKEATTDDSGIAVLKGLEAAGERKPSFVIASVGEKGGELCYLDLRRPLSGEDDFQTDGRPYIGKGYEAFITPERGAYRPGELVHLFGHVRGRDAARPDAAFPLELVLERPDNKELPPIRVMPTATGSFALEWQTQQFAQTGLYKARLQLAGTADRIARGELPIATDDNDYEGGGTSENALAVDHDVLGDTEFFVEEFLPNRLKVDATAPEKRFTPEEPLAVQVKAQEMFGQPAAGRSVDGVATFTPQSFAPEKWKGYTFGDPDVKFSKEETQIEESTTADDGSVSCSVTLPDSMPAAALQARVQITVKDVGGRGVTAAITRTIDPVPYYIGLKSAAETFPAPGKEAEFEVVGVKPDGSTVSENRELTATVSRVIYNSVLKREGSSVHWETNRELKSLKDVTVTLKDGKARVAFTPPVVGAYMLKARDPQTSAISALQFYASNDKWDNQPWSMEKPERVELVADKQLYSPGETARVLVKAPFAGTLLLSQEQDGVLSTTIVQMDKNTVEVPVAIEQRQLPNVYLTATVLRAVKPAEKWLPHRAFGLTNVKVESGGRRLGVAFETPEAVKPREGFDATLTIADAATSKPVGDAEVTLWAVDEGILTLTDFSTPNPLDFFFAPRRLMVETADFLSDLMPELIAPAGTKSEPGGGDEGAAKRASPVSAERVKPVVIWLGTKKTDADGKLKAHFDVPQFFGRLRVMAVAADARRFGSGDQTVFVRGPIMVKDNLPRFVAPGDQFFPSFVLYNNEDSSKTIHLTWDLAPPLRAVSIGKWKPSDTAHADAHTTGVMIDTEVGGKGQQTRVAEVWASKSAGVSVTTFTATSGNETFSDSIALPVRPAAPNIRLASSDTVDAGKSKLVGVPGGADWMAGTTTATLVVSGLPTVRLAGGLDYLVHYPYGCAEQTVSSAFPLLFFPDLAEQMAPGRFTKDGIVAKVQAGIDRVLTMQTGSGGISMWPGNREPDQWISVYAAHFLVEAKKAGYEVPEDYLRELLSYDATILSQQENKDATDTDKRRTLTQRAYAVYVLALGGRRNLERMEQLFEQREDLPVEARALLASAYMAIGAPQQGRELLQGVPLPKMDAPRETGGIFYSPVREHAILLSAFLDAAPDSPEIPGLVKRLEDSAGRRGYWGTTQENAFAIFALGKYAKAQAQGAGGIAEGTVKLAGGGTREFSTSHPLTLATRELAGTTVTIENRGSGRAYVFSVMEGVPLRGENAATTVSHGLHVMRRFTDREGNPLDPRRLPQGKLVVVEVLIDANYGTDLRNVAVEDMLPAGLEVENANLATSEKVDEDSSSDDKSATEESDDETGVYGPNGLRVQRTEVRDDRIVAFVDLYPVTQEPPAPSSSSSSSSRGKGKNAKSGKDAKAKAEKGWVYNRHIFRYAARAITPGTFALPPAQVSCMYDPDIVARGGAGTVSVMPKPKTAPQP